MHGEPIVIEAHGRHAQAVEFTRDGKKLVSVGQDARVRIWSVPGFRPAGAFEGHTKSVNSISFTPDGKRLATASTDGTVRIWSFPKGKTLRILPRQVAVAFSPDGRRLATVSAKGRVVLWDARSGSDIATLPVLDRRILPLAFTGDGRTLLAGGAGPIYRVALPEGSLDGSLEGHRSVVACLCLSPDGKLLASTGADGALRIWSTRTWRETLKISLRAKGIFQIAFAPDGRSVTVGADNLIRTFGVKDGALLDRIDLPVKGLYGLAISPDGKFLANAAADGKVRIWERR
jgi:WD40 repeat protein